MNGKIRRRIVDVVGVLPSVVFSPDDLRIVKDSAERRRAAIDSLGTQISPAYAGLRADYDRVLRQRNALLRGDDPSPSEMEPWTERMVELGAALSEARSRLVARLGEQLVSAHDEIAPGNHICPRYEPSWVRDGVAEHGDDATSAMRALLKRRRGKNACAERVLPDPIATTSRSP